MIGILTRYNKRSVTVISETGERWTVAPQFLNRVVEAEATEVRGSGKVIQLKKDVEPLAPRSLR